MIEDSKIHILLDNDELIHLAWIFRAKRVDVDLVLAKNIEELEICLKKLDSEKCVLYLDFYLENRVLSLEFLRDLNCRGFLEIYICTGAERIPSEIASMVSGVRSKEPPW